jgi:hypothetical protein
MKKNYFVRPDALWVEVAEESESGEKNKTQEQVYFG